jgi:hypothetical protein
VDRILIVLPTLFQHRHNDLLTIEIQHSNSVDIRSEIVNAYVPKVEYEISDVVVSS